MKNINKLSGLAVISLLLSMTTSYLADVAGGSAASLYAAAAILFGAIFTLSIAKMISLLEKRGKVK